MHQVQHGEAAITPNRKKECLPLSFAMFSTCCRSTKSTAPVGPEARYPTTLTPLAWRGNWKEGLQKRGPDLGSSKGAACLWHRKRPGGQRALCLGAV